MENSHGTSMRQPVCDGDRDDKVAITAEDYTQEESGWTAYFQDFSNNNIENNINHYGTKNHLEEISFSCTSSSLVSDAASYAAWKISDQNNNYNSLKTPKKLNFKKTRAKVISGDDSLEDTASSPVNSPKVSDMIKTKLQTDDLIDNSVDRKATSKCYSELHPEERSLVEFNGKRYSFEEEEREKNTEKGLQ